jgi:Fe2+ or Zn2+ uptake regulation protein
MALDEFSRHGIIKMLGFDKMENRYETNREEHINLICERCKKILDYKVPVALDQRGGTKKTGSSITDTRLEYYGIQRNRQPFLPIPPVLSGRHRLRFRSSILATA